MATWLILGGGAVTEQYYLPAFRILGVSDVMVVEADARRTSSLRKRFPEFGYRTEDYRTALASHARVSRACIVALPNRFHAAATEAALESGLAVLCEKPLAMTAAECERLGEISARLARPLAVGMVRRHLFSFQEVAAAARDGRWGPLESLDFEFGGPYAWVSDSGAYFERDNGGVLADMGVHFLDYAVALLGDLEPLKYKDDARGGVEANVRFELRSKNGRGVRVTLSRTRPLREILIFRFRDGNATIARDDLGTLWFAPKNAAPFAVVHSSTKMDPLTQAFARQLDLFLASVMAGASPASSASEAARVMRLIEWAYFHRAPSSAVSGPASSPGRVVVTGATGFIGTRLVERLFDEGHTNVVAPVRNYFTCAAIARFPILMPKVDLLDFAQTLRALRGVRRVFHLAYGRDGWGSSRVTIEGTKNVVRAAIENGAESVVVLSSIYVFGRPEVTGPVDESYPYRPIGAYGRSKAEMEQWCLRVAKNSKTRIIVLNPSCVYGPGGTTYTRLPLNLAKQVNFCWVDNGAGTANYIYIDNLIDAMLSASTMPEGHGKRLIVTDGHCTWKEFLEPFLGAYSTEVPSCGFRELAARRDRQTEFRSWVKDLPIAPHLRPVWKMLRKSTRGQNSTDVQRSPDSKKSTEPVWWLADLFHPAKTTFTAQKARDLLHWQPRVGLHEGQKRTVEWLRENGYFDAGAAS